MIEFTPGPWFKRGSYVISSDYKYDGKITHRNGGICRCLENDNQHENAGIISQTPHMYEVLYNIANTNWKTEEGKECAEMAINCLNIIEEECVG